MLTFETCGWKVEVTGFAWERISEVKEAVESFGLKVGFYDECGGECGSILEASNADDQEPDVEALVEACKKANLQVPPTVTVGFLQVRETKEFPGSQPKIPFVTED